MDDLIFKNQVFERLWSTAGDENFLQKAKKPDGSLALKGCVDGTFRFLVLAADNPDSIVVRLIDKPGECDRVDSEGIIQFAHPLNTTNSSLLFNEVEAWLKAYELIFGLRSHERRNITNPADAPPGALDSSENDETQRDE